MLPVEDALDRILAAFEPLPAETVAISQAAGRVLAAPLVARRSQPPMAVSAMDGWAVRAADVAAVPVELRRIGESAAGGGFPGRVGPGEAVRIFTGAPVPDGADCIVIQEDTDFEADGGSLRVREGAAAGRYIRPAGLDFREGDRLLEAGRLLGPAEVALAAAMNLPWLEVHRRPRVALLATGDELIRPGDAGGPEAIVSSNALGLAALIRRHGGEAIDLGIARDRRDALLDGFRAARGSDLLVTLGGASVGEHDLVRQVLGESGAALDFWKIAMRPGKPLMFGRAFEVPLLGLPGNPVSALVCALVFLRPVLERMLGQARFAERRFARLGSPLPANDRRQDYLRARLETDEQGEAVAFPFPAQDSSMLATLAAAGCLVIRPPHAPAADAGQRVEILPLAG